MRILPAILLFVVTAAHLHGQSASLVWEENFNEGHLNLNRWSYETGTGVNGDWGTGQLDRATDRLVNVSFQSYVPGAENGCLVITTMKEFYIDRNYTSGRILTAGKASWGPGHRIVARVWPRDVRYKGQGFAFWMMPDEIPAGWSYLMWPQGGEIDIMEYVGSIPFHNLGTVHYAWFWQDNQWADWNHGHQGAYYSYATAQVPIPSEPGYGGYPPLASDQNAGSYGFHNYGIDWYSDRIEFFVDGNVYHIHYLDDGGAFQKDGQDGFAITTLNGKRVAKSEYSNHFPEWHPFEHRMYIILSAGVGGQDYTYGGPVVPEAEFPCSLFVDWVRVYDLGVNTAVEETAGDRKMVVYPNPAGDILNVRLNDTEEHTLRLTDLAGTCVLRMKIRGEASADISSLPAGAYIISVTGGTVSLSEKIIVR